MICLCLFFVVVFWGFVCLFVCLFVFCYDGSVGVCGQVGRRGVAGGGGGGGNRNM